VIGARAGTGDPGAGQAPDNEGVFQRTPNFCVPTRNGCVDSEVTKAHDGVRQRIKNSFFGFELNVIPRSVL
jgi:hypothetical protein